MKLDKKSVKILRCLSKQGSLDNLSLILYTDYELKDVDERIGSLLAKELIQIDTSNDRSPLLEGDMFKLSPDGEAYLQHHALKMLLVIVPIILAAITAIASVLALLV